MARQVIETLVDDIDGSKATETVRFSLASGDFEIDLSALNAEALRRELAPFVSAARKVTNARPGAKVTPKGGGKPKAANAAIREWARLRDLKVGDKGRVPRQVEEAYEARTPLERAQDDSAQAELGAAFSA